MNRVLAAALPIAVSACAATPPPDETSPPIAPPPGQCDASGVQNYVGEVATEELGAILMQETGASILRWIPPRTAMTMDYRIERLTVAYDDDMVIERISCG
tara:strand:- start:125 stop:427 length:303 start_codon:yes stop_codon:yes gene_type:complete